MGQLEGIHLVSERNEECTSSQVVESRGTEKKSMPEKEISVTLSDKKRCFACHERSHNLDQCRLKYKLGTAAHQFGYATKFPFAIIQPSEEMVEKEKFYHHCVLITSNITNMDKGALKHELNKFWNMSGDWELRRESSITFLASFSSEGDVLSCLKHSKIETVLDNKEVKFTVTRWKDGDGESLDFIEEWLLVCGVPRIYRNWNELYQVASAFGVLIDVDEERLQVGDKEPIRLKISSRCFDGASLSYYFVLGWSSRLVMVTVMQDKTKGMKPQNKKSDKEHKKDLIAEKSILLEERKDIEESRLTGETKENKISAPAATITNSKEPATETSKHEGAQSIGQSPTSMLGEEHFRGIQKPHIKHVFKRRGKKQQVTEAINKSPSNKMDKGMGPESSSNATRTGASTGCIDTLGQKDCSEMECKSELNMEDITPVGESIRSEELGACGEAENNIVAADGPTINSKKT